MKKSSDSFDSSYRSIIVLFLFISLIFLIFLFIFAINNIFVDEVLLGPPQDLIGCGVLDVADTVYTLQNDVTNAGTCFTIAANGVTIEGQGHSVNYGTGSAGSKYGVFVDGANNSIIRNLKINEVNNDGTSKHGIYLIGANNALVEGNTITGVNHTSNGIFLYSGSSFNTVRNNMLNVRANGIYLNINAKSNIIDDNNVVTSDTDTTRAIYLNTNSDFNKIINNNVTTYNLNGRGIQIQLSSHNVIDNNLVFTFGDSASGMRVESSAANNTFSNDIVKTFGSNSYAFVISSSDHSFVLRDSVLQTLGSAEDFRVSSGVNGGQWNLTNVSFNDISWAGISGELNVYRYLDARAQFSGGGDASGANIIAWDNNDVQQFSELTGSNGRIARKELLEYTQTGPAASVYYSDYVFNATLGSEEFSQSWNMNMNRDLTFTFNSVVPDTTAPVVTINLPASNITYGNSSLPLNFSVGLNENGTVSYSLDLSITNYSMTSTDENGNYGRTFSRIHTGLISGGYIFSVYASDVAGNKNYTSNVGFNVNITSNSSIIECPNTICEAGETCNSCPNDCGSCPATNTTNSTSNNTGTGNNNQGSTSTPSSNTKNTVPPPPPVVNADALSGQESDELQKVVVDQTLQHITVRDGEQIVLVVGSGIEYSVSFVVSEEGVKVVVSDGESEIPLGDVIKISLSEEDVYAGVSELQGNKAVIAISLDRTAVKNDVRIKGERLSAAYVLFSVFILLLIIAVVLAIYYFLSKNTKNIFNALGKNNVLMPKPFSLQPPPALPPIGTNKSFNVIGGKDKSIF